MSTGTLRPAGLHRMREVLAAHVDRGEAPGLVALLAGRDEVHTEIIGAQAVRGRPMRADTIFRIASMTKPIVTVAALTLVEECVLRLDEPVRTWLPELAEPRVLRTMNAALDDTVPVERPITLRDLLTFRMGSGMILAPAQDYPVLGALAGQDVAPGPPNPERPLGPDEWLRRFGALPLMCQPGTRWQYHTAFSVLGVLLARATGKPLDAVLRERVFDPLGMRDTGFSVPEEKLDRLATSYWPDEHTGAPVVYDGVTDSRWRNPPAFPDAADGLLSTVDDYRVFGQMLLNGGRHGPVRMLSPAAVLAMRSDQLADGQAAASGFLADNQSWGFGLAVTTRRTGVSSNPGQFGWDGGLGTSWCADPGQDMQGILLTQAAGGPEPSRLYLDFWTCVYQAVE